MTADLRRGMEDRKMTFWRAEGDDEGGCADLGEAIGEWVDAVGIQGVVRQGTLRMEEWRPNQIGEEQVSWMADRVAEDLR